MKIIQEREAFEEGFERLQRIYKEWHRNPSALVRDSLKKYLIECYDHLLKLDRIDIDAGKFEDEIMSDRHVEPVEKDMHIPKIEIVVEDEIEPETITEEVTAEEKIEAELEEAVEAEIKEEEILEEINAEVETKEVDEINEEVSEEEIVAQEVKEETELDPNEVYLSGSEEREIEEFFKNNFPEESKVDETEAPRVETAEEEEIIAEQTEEEVISEELAAEEVISEEAEERIVAEEETEEEVSEEVKMEKEEEVIEAQNEEVEEESEKSRWSSFFSKDEPKPFEDTIAGEPQQLTLADKLATTKKEEGVHYEMKEQAITDLNSAIPIAKKFEFIRELFGDDSTNYKTAVASLNDAEDVNIAMDIAENLAETYTWSSNEKIAEEFKTFINRRFS